MSDDPQLEQCKARIGTLLGGRWRIDSLIGVGGMAAVYGATHRIGRRGAIKILHSEIAVSKEHRARFEQEALAVNQVGHPAVVSVFDIDTTEDGSPFLVMELLDGESLGQRVKRDGGVEERELLRIAGVVLEVLELAHGLGIVHRDIKPDNLFLTSSGGVKVLDFGIARMKQGGAGVRTRVGAMLGTTAYMPPEQIIGGQVDGRADVFALGATMFRILAKRHVHKSSTEPELLIKMAKDPAPALRSVAPSVSPEVCSIVDRALAFDPSRRYPTAHAMREDIERVLGSNVAPHSSALVSIRTDGSPAISIDAPTMAAMAPGQAMQAPIAVHVRPQDARTSAKADSKAPFSAIALIASLAVAVCLAAIFFVVRSQNSTEDAETSRTDKANDGNRSSAKPSNTRTPSSTAGPTAARTDPTTTTPSSTSLPVPNGKYRLLLKDGKYPFCVTSALKHAYPVRTRDDGVQVCNGTPEGPIPIESFKKYDPSEFQWK
jgi:serine/threonine protein kinase